MRINLSHQFRKAFTRVDFITVIASATMLGALGISVLGNSPVRSDSAVCANNLRQVGRAFHIWASDHGGENPWWTSYNDGGSYINPNGPPPPGNTLNVPGAGPRPASLRNNTWFQFAYISQELRTPALLLCPSDRVRSRAQDFSNSSQGFFSLSHLNRAVSYFVGMHALSALPTSMLSGDKSLLQDSNDTSCSANVGVVNTLSLDGSPPGWNSFLHPNGGNLLLNDGRVEELSAQGLASYLIGRTEENGVTHFMRPQ